MCFSLAWVQSLLVELVIICAVVAIIKLVIPFLQNLLSPIMGGGAAVVCQVIMICLWVVIAIFVIYLLFGLLSCAFGAGGLHFGVFPTR